jgi:hypothetical protein
MRMTTLLLEKKKRMTTLTPDSRLSVSKGRIYWTWGQKSKINCCSFSSNFDPNLFCNNSFFRESLLSSVQEDRITLTD